MTTQPTIIDLLASIQPAQPEFATQFERACDPGILVNGLGPIELPITPHTAHRLCAIAQPAKYGLGEDTVLDLNVRDTWEISASEVSFTNQKWHQVLTKALQKIHTDLCMPDHGKLRAELDKLLIYGPNQFFLPHQDSEKAPGMLATLTVTLPSVFTGGVFTVKHQDKTLRSKGSETALNFVAFYADCEHEAQVVEEGYRVVLTYKLILDAPERVNTTQALDPKLITDLTKALQSYFDPSQGKDRLVFFMDFEYTEHSLRWSHLKGVDRLRARALAIAAKALDADVALAQAEVQETWAIEPAFDPYDRHYGRYASYTDDFDKQCLIDGQITLHYLRDADDHKIDETYHDVDDNELCWVIPTDDFEPFEMDVEGYTGNAGNTADYWYHRAAVVIWPRSHYFILLAKSNIAAGFKEIARLIRTEQYDLAMSYLQLLKARKLDASHWRFNAANKLACGNLLTIAAHIPDRQEALSLLQPLSFVHLSEEAVQDYLNVLDKHEIHFSPDETERWFKPSYDDDDLKDWVEITLPALLAALNERNDSDKATQLARSQIQTFLSQMWGLQALRRLDQRSYAWDNYVHDTHPDANKLLALLLKAISQTQDDVLITKVNDDLSSPQADPLVVHDLLQQAHNLPIWNQLTKARENCAERLRRELARQPRQPNDWSISTQHEYFGTGREILTEFLYSLSETKLIWPLAKRHREKICDWIDKLDMPIAYEVVNTGSPHKLILTKTKQLFERSAARRKALDEAYAWHEQNDD
ncbi:2OG-Fe(II) oxygenase [Orrella sp. 11846]|uniref:2OG-Fe(II) oxygenase n=1 Tax=Orrella sp. 11846 TaxID=3409913 RepID=UPI003B5B1640